MKIRDRVKELRRVPASELIPNESNWRTHSTEQLHALREMMKDVGFVGVELAYEKDGRLHLIDGHARATIAGNETVPVLVLDVNEHEAQKILVTFDPLGAMAGINEQKRLDLYCQFSDSENETLKKLAENAGAVSPDFEPGSSDDQGQLDELLPKIVQCTQCGVEFDLREQG